MNFKNPFLKKIAHGAVAVLGAWAFGAGNLLAQPSLLILHRAEPVSEEIVLDGQLNEKVWSELPVEKTFYDFYKNKPTPSPVKSEFMMGYTQKGVYMGIRCFEDNMEALKAEITQRGSGDLWQDDCLEVYIDVVGKAIGYRKFMVNSIGTQSGVFQLDAANIDSNWCPDGWQVATSKDDQGWYVELYFPWSDLGSVAKAGSLWRLGINRFAYTGKRKFSNSAPGLRWSNPKAMGYLYFSEGPMNDPLQFGRELKSTVTDDWLLPVGTDVLIHQEGKVEMNSMAALLGSTLSKIKMNLKVAEGLVETDEELKRFAELTGALAAIQPEVDSVGAFNGMNLSLADRAQEVEDFVYGIKLKHLLKKS